MTTATPKRWVTFTGAACRAELHELCSAGACDCSCHNDDEEAGRG